MRKFPFVNGVIIEDQAFGFWLSFPGPGRCSCEKCEISWEARDHGSICRLCHEVASWSERGTYLRREEIKE